MIIANSENVASHKNVVQNGNGMTKKFQKFLKILSQLQVKIHLMIFLMQFKAAIQFLKSFIHSFMCVGVYVCVC